MILGSGTSAFLSPREVSNDCIVSWVFSFFRWQPDLAAFCLDRCFPGIENEHNFQRLRSGARKSAAFCATVTRFSPLCLSDWLIDWLTIYLNWFCSLKPLWTLSASPFENCASQLVSTKTVVRPFRIITKNSHQTASTSSWSAGYNGSVASLDFSWFSSHRARVICKSRSRHWGWGFAMCD